MTELHLCQQGQFVTGTDNRCASHRSSPTCATVLRLLAPSGEVGGQDVHGHMPSDAAVLLRLCVVPRGGPAIEAEVTSGIGAPVAVGPELLAEQKDFVTYLMLALVRAV